MSDARGEVSLGQPAGAAVAVPSLPGGWRRRLVGLLRPVFALAGLGMLALLVRKAGPRELGTVLAEAAAWLPCVALLELGRQCMDALATRSSYGAAAGHVPLRVLARAQLIGTAVSSMAPAGRAAAEATKAAFLTPHMGGGTATAAAATSQSASLAAGGFISFPCALASYLLTGMSLFTVAMLVHGVVLVALSAGVRACMRAKRPGVWLACRFRRWSSHAEQFQATARCGSLLPWRPTLAFLGSRVLQVGQYAVLTHAVGIDTSLVQALFSQGLYLCALAVGSLVPGQVGVSDGAFALAAGVLDTTAARAMSVALLGHVVQLLFVVAGALTPLVWRVPPAPRPAAPAPECR
ncbi:lysylphosphatidylglycerol synthase domain-containing protein [Myxococcus sp. RHSTA-1-4]|uniref:lysylphosphatidylglycerol synthase domain-containing protein n=1 Tax=Myxococcus sp. RHSTA-1-4 TaxID=2874601 RepID=UPI001CBB3E14